MKKFILLLILFFGSESIINAEVKRITSGNQNAKITIIVYESLTCSHCASFHEEVYPEIKRDYIDTGLAKIEFRHFPLDVAALNASKLAQCKNNKSLEILEALYSNQQAWVKGGTIEEVNINLNKYLAELNLQNLVLNHTEWKNFKITQIELQHNEKYNYQSTWHRDWNNSNLENIVMIIYLTDQKGFRLVKRAEDLKLALNYPGLKEKSYKFGYTNLPKDYFYEFDVKAGDIALFDAGLLHQGFVKGKRTHFFIRCKEVKKQISKNFNEIIEDHLQVDVPIEVLEQDAKKDSYNYDINYFSLNSRIKSLIHLVLYFFPIHKIFKYLKDRKKKFIHFHYSYFQK